MAGRADDLDSPLVSLVVGFCTHESREEGMVNVDDMVRIFAYHLFAEDLHVAGQDYEGNPFLAEQLHLGALDLLLVGMVLGYGPDMERYAELVRDFPKVLVVAHYAGDLDIPLPCLVAGQEVIEAMALLAHEDGHARLDVAEEHVELHLETL